MTFFAVDGKVLKNLMF